MCSRRRPASALPTSPAQAGLWFASAYGDDPTAYNQPLVLRLPVALDHDHLLEALDVVHQDHMALRTTFETDCERRRATGGARAPGPDRRRARLPGRRSGGLGERAGGRGGHRRLRPRAGAARARPASAARGRRHEPARVQRPSHRLRRHVLEAVPQPARGGLHRRRSRGAAGAAGSPPSRRGLRALDRALARRVGCGRPALLAGQARGRAGDHGDRPARPGAARATRSSAWSSTSA